MSVSGCFIIRNNSIVIDPVINAWPSVIWAPTCTEIFLVTTAVLFPSQGTSVVYLNCYRYSSSLT